MAVVTKTRDELVTMALEDLGVVESGQSPEDEDAALVDSRVDGLFADLASRGVVNVDDESAIPVEWTSALSELLADTVCKPFGKAKLSEPERRLIEGRLRALNASDPTGETVRSLYY